ncbi:hypothetical protein J2741_001419 [Methanolinea mesophila]|uniref:hypothetical protein n=1 Tax=Methanolinea mesophila TaxID=547055 RepID=UPI001AE2469A|nr:hypothetical protein [Methanolinea mesophila]MBP1928872.1 hypothetical protein [Methanolinea mesophila]
MKETSTDKSGSQTWITGLFVAGILVFGAGLLMLILGPASLQGGVSLSCISAGSVLMIISAFRLSGKGRYQQDERTRKIGAYGLSWSWFLTFIALFAIFWLNVLGLFTPDVSTLAVFLILLMGVSAKGFQWWFFRKGDVG